MLPFLFQLLQVVPSSPWLVATSLQCLPPPSQGFLLFSFFLCLSSVCILWGQLSLDLEPNWMIWEYLEMFNLLISAFFFPNGGAFTGSSVETGTCLSGRHHFTRYNLGTRSVQKPGTKLSGFIPKKACSAEHESDRGSDLQLSAHPSTLCQQP